MSEVRVFHGVALAGLASLHRAVYAWRGCVLTMAGLRSQTLPGGSGGAGRRERRFIEYPKHPEGVLMLSTRLVSQDQATTVRRPDTMKTKVPQVSVSDKEERFDVWKPRP